MRYRSRKFILATLLRWLELLDGGQWVTAVGGALAFYTAGNVAQKALQ